MSLVSRYIIGIFLISISLCANAERLDYGEHFSAKQVLADLKRAREKPPKGKATTRTLCFTDKCEKENDIPIQQYTNPNKCPSNNTVISTQIRFGNNRSLLHYVSFKTVGEIATIMNDPSLSGCHFLIEGHTNAIGSKKTNQRLSEKRAYTVFMLLKVLHVDKNRMATIGKGEEDLIPNINPNSKRNRRVQIRFLNATQ